MFPDVTFELNYEWSSEEGEGKQPGYFSANLQVCSYYISRRRQIREEQKLTLHFKANNTGFELLSDLAKSQQCKLRNSVL
jgi:hypothetical protein